MRINNQTLTDKSHNFTKKIAHNKFKNISSPLINYVITPIYTFNKQITIFT